MSDFDTQGSSAPYPPAGGAAPPAQPPKSKKTMAIVLVIVGVLILLCCCTVGIGIFAFGWLADEASISDVTITPPTPDDPVVADPEAERLDEWFAWSPETSAALGPASSSQQASAESVCAETYPDFTVQRVAVQSGSFNETDDVWESDFFTVLLSLDADPNAQLGVYFSAQTDSFTEDEWSWRSDSTPEGWELDLTADGVHYAYPAWIALPYLFGSEDPMWDDLMSQVAVDWPNGLVGSIEINEESDVPLVEVTVTTWDSYAVYGPSPVVYAEYGDDDVDAPDWKLMDWYYSN